MTEYTLGEICELKFGVQFKPSDYSDNGTPVLRVGNIQNGKVSTSNLCYSISEKFSSAPIVKPKNIVIANMGEPGKVGLNSSELSLIHSDVVIKCTPKNRAAASGGQGAGPVDNKFLYHWLRNSEPLMKSLIRGGVIPRINLEDLKKLKIRLPALENQKVIAQKLDTFLSLEQELEQELEQRQLQYEYYRNLLITEPKSVYCDSEKFRASPRVASGDVVIAIWGGSSAKIGINLTNSEIIFTHHLLKIVPNPKIVSRKFLFYYLSNHYHELKQLITHCNMPFIKRSSLEKLKIVIPPPSIQEKIVSVLDRFTDLAMDGELQNQLALRRQQYEYYRNLLVNPPVENSLIC